MPPAAFVAADGRSLAGRRKRKAFDDAEDDTRKTMRNLSVEDDPDFEGSSGPYPCPRCGRTFKRKDSMKRHRFKRKDSMKRHMPSDRCTQNLKKKLLQELQSSTVAAAPPVAAQGSSSSQRPGAAPSSATQQSQLSTVFHGEVPYLPAVQSNVQAPPVPRPMEPSRAATNSNSFLSISEPRSVQQLNGSPPSTVMAEDREGLFMPPTSLTLPLPTAHAMDAPVPDENAAASPFVYDFGALEADYEAWCSNADSTHDQAHHWGLGRKKRDGSPSEGGKGGDEGGRRPREYRRRRKE
ncbi:hypothetical protein DEU56DRAFT_765111 [Suillus clintonianus]|uniref:uncharacterized protein n=1 Tax=Suillus clintonianus TaxID=1904413 RepID=UPI001B865BB1|nr:uncharacterized protein DEU56DRAFT_765111 [Suillus clintonianus]KAG2157529.1 hypothetical protein DEU56DRAFT_765111 [Suillus clintonianus]